MTYGDFIAKLRDWNITQSEGSIGESVVLYPRALSPFVTVIKRNDSDILPDEVWHALLTNLGIKPDEFV